MSASPAKPMPVKSGSSKPHGSVFSLLSYQKIQAELAKQCLDKDKSIQQLEEYVHQLEALLREHHIDVPPHEEIVVSPIVQREPSDTNVIKDGTYEEIQHVVNKNKEHLRKQDLAVEFHNLSFTAEVSTYQEDVFSITSIVKSLFCFWKSFLPDAKKDVEILSNLTGRILPRKMTLLIGPPGSGKSVFLKALAGRLTPAKGQKLSGEVYYEGDNIHSNRFVVGKVADYIEQGDTHDAVLTVEETMKFSWLCATGGAHSYSRAKDETAAAYLDRDNHAAVLVQNVITSFGLKGCKDTYVGDGMIRGVSGGQKRRVTVGEMVVLPRPIKFMDSISNGLDSATTFDLVRATGFLNHTLGMTNVISLLQPPPDVYALFDEIILLCEGHIIYQGPREQIMSYFASLGYVCPADVDEADFLQELPTIQGKRFVTSYPRKIPHTPLSLSKAWKTSELYQQLLSEMKYPSLQDAKNLEKSNIHEWFPEQKEKYAKGFYYYFQLNLERQMKIFLRDNTFGKARIMQVFLVGAIAGSLFSNIEATDLSTMNGFLFNTILFTALGSFALLPLVYAQKQVFYKMKDSLFFPTLSFTLAQNITLLPLQILESIFYITIVYWSAGLSAQENGSRFLTFIIVSIVFSTTVGQLFRFLSAILPTSGAAMPIAGIIIVIMILFSGFIQPKSLISNGWIWFYYLNPVAWALKAVTVNEFKSSRYDFLTCTDPTCSHRKRYGDFVLEQYGNPTDERYIWYSFAVLIAECIFLFLLTTVCMHYIRTVATPPAPTRSDKEEEEEEVAPSPKGSDKNKLEIQTKEIELMETGAGAVGGGSLSLSSPAPSMVSSPSISAVTYEQLNFDQVSMAFKDIWYTVTLPNGEDVDLLKGVNGFFEPGTLTCLMGSSGAGKTTLLDVLAGRKNTGVVKGEIYLNGMPKVDAYFRKINGYVEQFDSLPQKSTAKEAIAFSAALRLAKNITVEQRDKWVNSVVAMLDLIPIQNKLIGAMDNGGMSFEQRKRVSIGVELAANPSILFLDEPTTGLDSLAAQSLIRNLRTIASSGRSIVCTIHQPSTLIFNAFDSLLLLKRGGQTVYFGQLGSNSSNLIDFFQAAPGVRPMPMNTNPATWMLDVIGAGTGATANKPIEGAGGSAKNAPLVMTDFAVYYSQSSLCEVNLIQLDTLCAPNEGSKKLDDLDFMDDTGYNASYALQFQLLMERIALTYWRSPNYTIGRPMTNILIALIFGSAYPQQVYDNYVATVSRSAVIYITSLFCSIIAMILVMPLMHIERPVFYREQQSRMYSVFVYCVTLFLIELPYLLISSVAFTLPFFYIVGFNKNGDVAERFFWYWFFNFLLQGTMLFLGEFFVALAPNEATTQVLGGLNNTVLGLFCGFLIAEQNFPTFWLFMYWMNPLHYALEGLITSQFHGDTTKITMMDGSITTAEDYITNYQFTTWRYSHIGFDVLALGIFIGLALVGNYLCLSFIRHDKR